MFVKALKTKLNTSFVFNRLQKLIKIFAVGRKIAGASRPSCYGNKVEYEDITQTNT